MKMRRITRPGPGTPVTVVGLARSGLAAARWLLQLGSIVRATEIRETPEMKAAAEELIAAGAMVEMGCHTPDFVRGSHLLVVSPGVPGSAPPVRWAAEAGIPVVNELDLGSWYCCGRTVAVTGSNGKSTVVTLIGEILNAVGKHTVVCGNIGTPLCSVLDRIQPSTSVVMEVSSFQLESAVSFHTEIACLLNITDNHLDRHGSFARYRAIKSRLFASQSFGSWGVFNGDDGGSTGLERLARGKALFFSRRKRVPGAFMSRGDLFLDLPGAQKNIICSRGELALRGAHHEENALAASCAAGLLGVSPAISGQVLRTFKGLPHRQQAVGRVDGVTFINDSKSTTVASGIRAIEAAPGQVVLIAGGRDKGSDFRKLKSWARKLKAAVLIGEDGPKIASCLKGAVPLKKAGNLEEAVKMAFALAEKGECVLLSPMCASFDMFRDFEERGEQFTEAVLELTGGAGAG